MSGSGFEKKKKKTTKKRKKERKNINIHYKAQKKYKIRIISKKKKTDVQTNVPHITYLNLYQRIYTINYV